MATITTAAAVLAALLLLPLLILLWASETPQQRARRWRRAGHSFRTIGARLGVSHTTARRYCLA
jgi:ABC-type spermidine/putrescine transport system permease subunit II